MIGTTNTDGLSEISFGSNSANSVTNTRNLDITGTSNTWSILAADESNTQAFASYANDGDNDVFPGLSLRINDGSGNFSSTQIISTNTDGALSVYAIDLDGDGDKDVLSASYDDNKIAWYKNQLYAVGVPNEPNNLAANATALTCTLINNTSTPNTLQIQYNAPQTQPSTLQLYNIMGSLVAQQTFDATKGINTWQIPVGAYPAGVYLLQVSNTNSKETIKWIKE